MLIGYSKYMYMDTQKHEVKLQLLYYICNFVNLTYTAYKLNFYCTVRTTYVFMGGKCWEKKSISFDENIIIPTTEVRLAI